MRSAGTKRKYPPEVGNRLVWSPSLERSVGASRFVCALFARVHRLIFHLLPVGVAGKERSELPQSTIDDVISGTARIDSSSHHNSFMFLAASDAVDDVSVCTPVAEMDCCRRGAWYLAGTKVPLSGVAGFTDGRGRKVSELNSWGCAVDTLVPGRGLGRRREGHLLLDDFATAIPSSTRCFVEWIDGAFVP